MADARDFPKMRIFLPLEQAGFLRSVCFFEIRLFFLASLLLAPQPPYFSRKKMIYLIYSLLAVLALATFSLWYSNRRWANAPPGPRQLPVLGNLLDLQDGHQSFNTLAKTYGDLINLRLGNTVSGPVGIIHGNISHVFIYKFLGQRHWHQQLRGAKGLMSCAGG